MESIDTAQPPPPKHGDLRKQHSQAWSCAVSDDDATVDVCDAVAEADALSIVLEIAILRLLSSRLRDGTRAREKKGIDSRNFYDSFARPNGRARRKFRESFSKFAGPQLEFSNRNLPAQESNLWSRASGAYQLHIPPDRRSRGRDPYSG